MRVPFPLDTTGGISDRQNVITWPGVQPGVGPKTPYPYIECHKISDDCKCKDLSFTSLAADIDSSWLIT